MSTTDYSREAIAARLRRASELSASLTCAAPRVDMSREAIDRRLREASDLSTACLSLREAGRAAGLGAGRKP